MDCIRCEELLLERTEGARAGRDDPRVGEHLASCTRCTELARLLELEHTGELEPPGSLAQRVLRESIGAAGIGAVVRRLERELPALSWLEPDAGFTADVMAATAAAPPGLAARLLSVWERLVDRPRFALQAAYTAAVMLFLLMGLPSSPLAGVPGGTSSLLVDPERGAVQQVTSLARRAGAVGASTWSEAERMVERARASRLPDLSPDWLPDWRPSPESPIATLGRRAATTWDTAIAPLLERLTGSSDGPAETAPDSSRTPPDTDQEPSDGSSHSV